MRGPTNDNVLSSGGNQDYWLQKKSNGVYINRKREGEGIIDQIYS